MLKEEFKDTALLFFSRSAKTESQEKSILKGRRLNFCAISNMIEHTRKVAELTGLDVIVDSELSQEGNSFGEKLYNSILKIFESGVDNLIVIGNDCLNLRSEDILFAASCLKTNDRIFAPTKYGGVYLLGFRKGSISEEFKHIGWNTQSVFSDLKNLYLEKGNNYFFKRVLEDINFQNDLIQVINKLKDNVDIVKFVKSILLNIRRNYFSLAELLTFCKVSNAHRGPPLVI